MGPTETATPAGGPGPAGIFLVQAVVRLCAVGLVDPLSPPVSQVMCGYAQRAPPQSKQMRTGAIPCACSQASVKALCRQSVCTGSVWQQLGSSPPLGLQQSGLVWPHPEDDTGHRCEPRPGPSQGLASSVPLPWTSRVYMGSIPRLGIPEHQAHPTPCPNQAGTEVSVSDPRFLPKARRTLSECY